MTSTLCILILVEETIGRVRRDEVVRFGVQIPRGALRWSERSLDVALFPWECQVPFAPQGGECKPQTIMLGFGRAGAEPTLGQWQHFFWMSGTTRFILAARNCCTALPNAAT